MRAEIGIDDDEDVVTVNRYSRGADATFTFIEFIRVIAVPQLSMNSQPSVLFCVRIQARRALLAVINGALLLIEPDTAVEENVATKAYLHCVSDSGSVDNVTAMMHDNTLFVASNTLSATPALQRDVAHALARPIMTPHLLRLLQMIGTPAYGPGSCVVSIRLDSLSLDQ